MGGPIIAQAFENAFMQDGELQFGSHFLTAGDVRRPFEIDRRLEMYERRFRELVVTATETALMEVATIGASQGIGALSRALIKRGAGKMATSFSLSALNHVDDGIGPLLYDEAGNATRLSSNFQLVDDIATRSEFWAGRKGLTGTPREIGTAKHVHAKKVLIKYQSMFGNRGLSPEVRYVNQVPWEPMKGMPTNGSVILDVVDGPIANPITIYDYKFGVTGLKPRRINQIRRVTSFRNTPIIPVQK